MNKEIVHDIKEKSFYMEDSSGRPCLDYDVKGEVMSVYHTFVPPALRGKGIASRLGKAAAEEALKEGMRIKADCWFMKKFLEKNKKYSHLKI